MRQIYIFQNWHLSTHFLLFFFLQISQLLCRDDLKSNTLGAHKWITHFIVIYYTPHHMHTCIIITYFRISIHFCVRAFILMNFSFVRSFISESLEWCPRVKYFFDTLLVKLNIYIKFIYSYVLFRVLVHMYLKILKFIYALLRHNTYFLYSLFIEYLSSVLCTHETFFHSSYIEIEQILFKHLFF